LTSFNDLRLATPLLKVLAEEGYVTPTPIQAQAIPHVVEGRDLLGIAQTGTGKTAAFALPILNRLAQNPRRPSRRAVRVLVLSPTRELSGQILDSFRTYGRDLRLSSALVIGGVPMGRQIREVAPGLDILVATPGRLMDLFQNQAVRLDEVEVLVLDEADQMLDMGFIHAIRAIVAKLPKARQSLLFSATMPPAIAELAAQFLSDPARVAVTPVAKTADRVDQRVVFVERAAKGAALADLLGEAAVDRALVFTRTKRGADQVVRGLDKAGIAAEAIHGNKSQGQRDRALGAFRAGQVRILVATDIAARGIDVDGVSHVVNYDLPNIPESYVHRIGRTARAGAAGMAVSFCDNEERPYLRAIEKLIRQQIPASLRDGTPVLAGPAGDDRSERPGPRPVGAKSRRRRPQGSGSGLPRGKAGAPRSGGNAGVPRNGGGGAHGLPASLMQPRRPESRRQGTQQPVG